jgi:hypothetical protein
MTKVSEATNLNRSSMKKLLIGGCTIFVMAIVTIVWNHSEKPVVLPANYQQNEPDNDLYKRIKAINGAGIVYYKEWNLDSSLKLHCVVARKGEAKYLGDPREQLFIFDDEGQTLYEDEGGGKFTKIEFLWLTRRNGPQLVIHKNQGGRQNELQILDYVDGEIKEILAEFYSYEVWCEIRPSFRRGANPSADPYQVLLTDGVGLASPIEKNTKVFRFHDGKYRKVGEFKQTELDNQIEKMLIK